MPHFMMQWSFTAVAAKALAGTPQDREEPARQAVEAFGGRLIGYYFILGTRDGMLIADFPDTASAAACSLRVTSTGAFTAFETTPLLTAAEARSVMEKVKASGNAGYRPPSN